MSRFSNGLKIGAIIGALVGLLLSPKSGKENRQWVKENANQDNLSKTIKKGKNLLESKKQPEPVAVNKPVKEVKKTRSTKKTKETKKTITGKNPKK